MFAPYIHNNSTGFVSLSDESLLDVYPLSNDPILFPIPDITEMGAEAAKYFRLDSNFREVFFAKTGLTDNDKLFIIDYSTGVFASFPVTKLNVVAKVDDYTTKFDWPYSLYSYMIGFEIDSISFKKFTYPLVYIGKENPFIEKPLQKIVWEKIERKDLPEIPWLQDDTTSLAKFPNMYGNTYQFKTKGFEYYLQDYKHNGRVNSRRFAIVDTKKNKIVCKRAFGEGESTSLSPLNEQWTGKLFKDKAPVIFGYQSHSFGCPGITVMDGSEYDLGIYCDNRH